jgi:hypothetical protein
MRKQFKNPRVRVPQKKKREAMELDASPPIPTLCSSTKDWGTIMENLEKGIEDDENEL